MNISEIARLAGVSSAAVSRYLNNGYLSQEKKEAIRKVIEETGYRPLVQAQTLRTRKTKMIGVVLPKIDSFSITNVMAGIDSVLEKEGFYILMADTHNDPAKELEYLEVFDDQRVDGIILIATVLSPRHLNVLKKSRVPVVVVGQQVAGVSCVYHDDYNAFLEITRLVLDKGCRSLGYIGAFPQDKAVGQERRRAYCDAVREAGLEEQAEHVAVANFSISSGQKKAAELIASYGPMDALICVTDTVAVGALQYLKSNGVRVPGQTLLTGSGDSSVSGVTSPSITTIRFYYEESGINAAKLLMERLGKAETPVKEIKLGYQIIENDSTFKH